MSIFFIYIMASRSRNTYTGVTNCLERRVYEHQSGAGSSFAHRYRIDRLVYVEEYSSVQEAFIREKQIKGWSRDKKVRLIESVNPTWEDLSPGLFGKADSSLRSE